MAFEYDGKIYLNLEEQVEVNSRMAVDAKETAEAAEALVDSKADITYVDTELAKKVNKLTTDSGVKAYTFNSSGDYSLAVVDTATTAGTIVRRTSGGNIMCAPPSNNAHAATKAYVDNNFVAKQTTTSTAKRAYVYDNNGDTNVVISADNANGNTLVMRTNAGRIACADPNAAGQAATKGYVDDGFVAKVTGASRIYTNNPDGTPASLPYSAGVTPNSIPYRTAAGNIYTANPTSGGHAANKQYVDGIISKMSPNISAATCLDGLTWQTLYTAMSQNVNIFLSNPSSYLYSDTGDTTTTICNQSLHYVKDGSNYHFKIDFYKPNTGILSQAYTITSAGNISYYTI